MPREIQLMADVEGLGVQGDVVRVKDGYARNYLLPKGLGAPVTEASRRRLQRLIRKRAEEQEMQLGQAREVAARLAEVSCTIPIKAGPDGKLFGSVTAQHIAEFLSAQGVNVDRRQILLAEPIRELGAFDVPVRLHAEVSVPLKVWIVKE